MKQLSNKVSIVPVIAKADCLTQKEISSLKKTILDEIKVNGIKVYTLPDCDRLVKHFLTIFDVSLEIYNLFV